MHSGNGPHDEMDRLALSFFVAALDDAGMPDDPRLRATLTEYFDRGIARAQPHLRDRGRRAGRSADVALVVGRTCRVARVRTWSGSRVTVPPSIVNSEPVANDDSSLARNTTNDATSSGWPGRPSGIGIMSPASRRWPAC